MNILQITAGRGWGGGEKYVWELACALRQAGYGVSSVIMPGDEVQAARFAELDPHALPHRGLLGLGMISRLARIVRERQIDIIHVHQFRHATVALLCRRLYRLPVRVLLTRHLARPAKKGCTKNWLYRHIDRIAFVSEHSRQVFLSTCPRIDPTKLEVIHNSVREIGPGEFELGDIRNRSDITPDRFVIGFAGTVMPAKGVELLVELADRLRDPIFLVAGAGKPDYVEKLQTMIRERGLENYIRLIGRLDNVLPFYRQVDAVIVPSMLVEAFSLSTLEAMLVGKPIVMSENIPTEVIDDTEGYRMSTKDLTQSAGVIRQLMDDPTGRGAKAALVRRKFQDQFSYPIFLNRITELYSRI